MSSRRFGHNLRELGHQFRQEKGLNRAEEMSLIRLREAAGIDKLTQLANRRGMDEELLIRWARFKRNRVPFGVLILDLNKFKLVNDTLGHAAGDKYLKIVGEILKATTRKNELPARYGGDEFAILTEDGENRDMIAGNLTMGEKGAGPLLYRINFMFDRALRESKDPEVSQSLWDMAGKMIGDVPFRIGGGIAFSDESDVKNYEDLIRLADARLYNLKKSVGENRAS